MGDVALTAPVIHSIIEEYPTVEITFLSRAFFAPLFNKNSKFKFKSADLKDKHKGFVGLRKLYQELKSENFDAVIDLHDVLRTKVLRSFFKLSGTPVYIINKGRKEKKAIINKKAPLKELKHTQQRYLDVFAKAGLICKLKPNAFLQTEEDKTILSFLKQTKRPIIGIAPFAAHSSKEIGEEKLNILINHLTKNKNYTVLLFGGGEQEKLKLDKIVVQHTNCFNLVGKYNFKQELTIISKLNVMIAMDSGNMHLAALVGTRVVSIWIATHPYLGFSPYQNKDLCVQVPTSELPCRPCSVYGQLKTKEQKECALKAKKGILIENIISKIEIALEKN